MPRISLVVVCYNPWNTIKKTFDKLKTYKKSEIVIVDNHPPYKDVSKKIKAYCKKAGFKYIDAGSNIGCHQGYNLGFANAKGEFKVKNDDDTVPPEENEMLKLANFIEKTNKDKKKKKYAYIGINFRIGDFKEETKMFDQKFIKKDGLELAILGDKGIVNFSCVMFSSKILDILGPFRSVSFDAMGNMTDKDVKYGGEEVYYRIMAKKKGFEVATVVNLKAKTNANEDYIYTAWKYGYGFLGIIHTEFEKFRRDSVQVKRIMEIWLERGNDWHKEKAKKWLDKNKEIATTIWQRRRVKDRKKSKTMKITAKISKKE